MVAVTYERFERALQSAHALPDAPEAHGTLAGALCSSALYKLDDWLVEILPAPPTTGAAPSELKEVFDATILALSSPQSDFSLLLPDEDVAIADRTQALGSWCQGFLYGLGSGEIPDPSTVSPEAGEIVRDLSAIAQVGVDTSEDDETNEAAFAEVVEFVRVGVQLLFLELSKERGGSRGASPPATVH
jgi:uncharacterized protein YgfB (UPF0149 family)